MKKFIIKINQNGLMTEPFDILAENVNKVTTQISELFGTKYSWYAYQWELKYEDVKTKVYKFSFEFPISINPDKEVFIKNSYQVTIIEN